MGRTAFLRGIADAKNLTKRSSERLGGDGLCCVSTTYVFGKFSRPFQTPRNPLTFSELSPAHIGFVVRGVVRRRSVFLQGCDNGVESVFGFGCVRHHLGGFDFELEFDIESLPVLLGVWALAECLSEFVWDDFFSAECAEGFVVDVEDNVHWIIFFC